MLANYSKKKKKTDYNTKINEIDDKEKDILILGEGATQGSDHTTLTAEAKYHINFRQLERKICIKSTL